MEESLCPLYVWITLQKSRVCDRWLLSIASHHRTVEGNLCDILRHTRVLSPAPPPCLSCFYLAYWKHQKKEWRPRGLGFWPGVPWSNTSSWLSDRNDNRHSRCRCFWYRGLRLSTWEDVSWWLCLVVALLQRGGCIAFSNVNLLFTR